MAAEKRNKFREGVATETVAEGDENWIAKNDVEDLGKKTAERKNKSDSNRTKGNRNDTSQVANERANTYRAGSERTKPTDKPAPESKPAKDKISLMQRWQQFRIFYGNERTQKIMGLLLILFSAYLSIAFVSYFTSWDVDQDKVLSSDLFLPETKVKNWLGKFGALVSHLFMYKGFGVASFILVPVVFLYGLQKVVQRPFIRTGSFAAKWLFIMVWGSLLLSYIFSDKLFFMGGGFGYFINAAISNYVGNIGLLALLVFSMLSFLVLSINLSFKLPARPVNEVSEPELEEETQPEVKKEFNAAFNQTREPVLSAEEEAELLNFEVITRQGDPVTQKAVIEPAAEVQQESVGFEVIAPVEEKEMQELQAEPLVEPADNKPANGEPEFKIEEPVKEPAFVEEENKAARLVEQFGEYDPTLDLGSYQFPGFDLLNDYGSIHSKVNQEELVANKNRILNTLKNYGIEIEKIMATVGPTVTLYEIVPAAGVRISKIKNLEDDIALSLAALGIRIIAPIPGKGTIGIEVPNQTPEMVPMKNILASEKFNNSQFELPIALGKTISNEIFIADLAKMPHLLMAGATGQGKSVGLNAVLVSLLYKKHPSQVKFVLVDPKKVELTLFNKIERHFLAKLPNSEDAIITDNTKVIHTLNSLCIEMDNRYALLQDAQVRNIKEYNHKFVHRKLNPNDGHKFLPYIVLVVDEFADLIMTAGKEVETPIARLAQLARAIGIHLIIATQRPSVNIITGTIKANFPARIAFRVTSKIDSRTILDSGGADQLIGRGDMLLSTGNDLIRIQCAFVDTPEVEKITEFIGNQRAYPSAFMLPEYVGEDGESGKEDIDLSERDKMFDEAAKLIVQFQQGSASFLQRKLKLGYNRAGRLVDQLEAAGFIGPFEGSKAREVLIKDSAQMEEILQKLRNR
jgi:S-DNA-T family DNA segregation ATPase FtsK/SpoIIIE